MFKKEVFAKPYIELLKPYYSELKSWDIKLVSEETLDNLFEELYLPFVKKVWERVLMCELNFANEDGLIPGDTDEEKFEYYINHVADEDNLESIYQKYPPLKSMWQTEAQALFDSAKNMLERVSVDVQKVSGTFFDNIAIRTILEIKPMGDPHKGLQQASRVTVSLDDGSETTYYYKPRDLSIDEGYFQLINWWNDNCDIKHKAPQVIQKKDYGYVSAIAHLPCNSADDVRKFFTRYGSLIGFTYVFCTTDLHMENIIASGECPVIVDIETLFSCEFSKRSDLPIKYHLYHSLLLPSQVTEGEVEISPLGAIGGKETTVEVSRNPNKRVLDLKMEKQKYITQESQNVLKLNDTYINFEEYADEIIKGFKETIEFIRVNKKDFETRVLELMGGVTVRILSRSTKEYAKTLYNMYHPQSLYATEQAKDTRALAIDYFDENILVSEITELANGDIPFFETKFDNAILLNGQKQEVADSIFQSSKQRFLMQMTSLSEQQIDFLTKDIEYSFLAFNLRSRIKTKNKIIRNIKSSEFAKIDISDRDKAVKLITFGSLDNLKKQVQYTNGLYHWRNIGFKDEETVSAEITDIDLYNGMSGIALAYYQVGKKYNHQEYLNFADKLCQSICKSLDNHKGGVLGHYSGATSAIYALAEIYEGRLYQIHSIVEAHLAYLSYTVISTEYNEFAQLDIIAGLAGTIMGLLELHQKFIDWPLADNMRALLKLSFNTLLVKAKKLQQDDTMIGFSHGTAGVSAALARYMDYFEIENEEAVALILQFTQRESTYRNQDGWIDIRNENDNRNITWCHGTVGFGFARHYIKNHISADQYNEDMSIVISRLGEEQNSLAPCHGMTADLWLLNTLENDQYNELHQKVEVDILTIIKEYGLRTDFGLINYESVGFMTGVAGIICNINHFKL